MRTKLILALAAGLTLTSLSASANRGRWFDDHHENVRRARVVELGTIELGNDGRRGHFLDRDVLDIRNNPRLECNLTHLKFSALGDSVRILRVELQYKSGQVDSLDLTPDNFGGAGQNRRGLRLQAFQSSQWLNVNDVLDQRDNGRCIDKVRVTGIDTPNFGERRHGGGRPALVKVEGLAAPRLQRPPHREPMLLLGSMKFTLFKSDNEGFKNTNVLTPVRKLAIDAEGGTVYLKRVVLTYTNGRSYTLSLDKTVQYEVFAIPEGVIASVAAKGTGGKVKLYVSR